MSGTKNFQCKCPCHEDKKPSLVVSINNSKGKSWVNAYCFAGCHEADIDRMLKDKGFNLHTTTKQKTFKDPETGDSFISKISHKLFCEYRDSELVKYERKYQYFYRDIYSKDVGQFKPVTLIMTRTDTPDGKTFTPHTLWKDKATKEYKWKKKGPPTDWKRLPYFASGHLTAEGIDTVMIHEGEKATSFAHDKFKRLENVMHVSWMGGSQVPLKTNWDHFKGKGIKEFILVPDNDDQGVKAMYHVAGQLTGMCDKVMIVNTSSFPAKWDIADIETEEDAIKFHKLLNERTEVLQSLQQYAYVGEIEKFIDLETGGFLTERAYSNIKAYERQDRRGAEAFMMAKGSIIVPKVTFNPDTPKLVIAEDGIKKLNMYRPYEAIRSEGNVDKFLNHMNYLMPDEMNMWHVVSWMAHVAQWPATKILHCLLLFSEAEGVGKTTLFKCLQYALGKSLARQVEQHEVANQFNPWAKNKLLIAIEEIAIKGDYETRTTNMDRFKYLITEDMISINEKNVKQYQIPNRMNIMMFSNSRAPITLGRLARRYYVWDCEVRRKPDQYYKDLYSWLKDGGFANVYDYLLKYDVSNWDCTQPPPKTEHFFKLVDRTQTPAHLELDELYDSNSWPFNDATNLLSPAHLKRALSTIKINIGTNHITDWIKKRGGSKLAQIEWLNNQRPTVWTTGDREAWNNAMPNDIAKQYLEPLNDRGELYWMDFNQVKRLQTMADIENLTISNQQ